MNIAAKDKPFSIRKARVIALLAFLGIELFLLQVIYTGNPTDGEVSILDEIAGDISQRWDLLFMMSLPVIICIESFFFRTPFTVTQKLVIVIQGALAIPGLGYLV